MAKKVKVSSFGSANNAPTPPSGRVMLFVLGALVLLIVGFVAGKSMGGGTKTIVRTERAEAVGQTKGDFGPKSKKGIVPVGFDHSQNGAIAAATSYVSLAPQLYLAKDSAFTVSVAQISTSDFFTDLKDGLDLSRARMRGIFNADPNAFYREVPIVNTAVEQDKDHISVEIYSIVMLAAKPDFNGNTEGKIHTLDLVWEDKDWKISRWSTKQAPTPKWTTPGTTVSVDEYLDAIGGFSGDYNYVPAT